MKIITSIEKNFFAIGRYWGNLNGSFVPAPAIYAMSSGIPTDDLNWVWNEKPLTRENGKTIDQIKNYYEQLSLPFWWWVYPTGQSPLTEKMLQSAGLHFFKAMPCLAADLSAQALPAGGSSDLEIKLVRDKNDLSLWENTSFAGFDIEDYSRKQYKKFIASFDISSGSPQQLLLACWEGNPAATALLFFYQDTAGIYFVSTLPGYRRKGIGLTVTLAAMQYAKVAGFKLIILQSSELGLNIYKEAGFQEYCCANIYSCPTF